MLPTEMLAILRCPEDRSALTAASDDVIAKLNAEIRDRKLANKAGHQLEAALDGGFIRADGKRMYPVVNGIPLLMSDEAIDLDQVELSH